MKRSTERILTTHVGSLARPEALVPITVDVEADQGLYVEPNVWMHHA